MNVNLIAHFWTLKAFLGGMVERDRGHIVALSSITAVLCGPRLVDYCTSKAGVAMMMAALRQEILYQKKYGVGFTTILPTKVDTGLFEGAKGRFGMLPPTVKPEYIAMKTIEAIERDQTYVVLPPWFGALLAMKPLLPQKLMDVLMRFTELDEAMKEFTGHKKEI
ncbi:Epidermal retinol dehydrogenase 2 [Paramuricea clavata]|uniref:Epidermal retinol dehydrogenase 2 n=1 Tax=Paramuricea clavata TaxID=317549 RepID=A0A7D9L3W8_PARCT|nr:Epidermal retinol dehydrogenase 2 [Paramuricea clavata]